MSINGFRMLTTPLSSTLCPRFADASTYNNSTSMKVYDVKGQAVTLTYFFQKAANDTWNVYAAANGESLVVDGSGQPQAVTTLQFPPNGSEPTSTSAQYSGSAVN